MRPQVGQVIHNKYRLLRLIGDGGMGSVFEARHEVLGTTVALKFLHPELSRRSGLVQRFLQEARVSAQIQSPHVVRVTDVDQNPNGQAFIVMEYLEGKTLQTLYEELYHARQRLSYADALEYAMQMLEGVEAAHTAGVVHRDLKPGNVLLARAADGLEIAKISDFGISRFDAVEDDDAGEDEAGRGANEEPQPETLDRPVALWAAETEARQEPVAVSARTPPAVPLTGTGVVMGTPAYMAPEIRRGARFAKPASDLFAFGLIAYEILAGRAAFSAPPIHLAFTMKRLPAVEPLPPEVPAELGALVLSCLAEAPSLRPAASEAASVLARATGKSVA